MFYNNANVEMPKVTQVTSCCSEISDRSRIREEKIEKILENIHATIEANEDTISQTYVSIDKYIEIINKLNDKIIKLEKNKINKKKVLKLKENLKYYEDMISNLEKIINDLNLANEKCTNLIANIKLVTDKN